MKTTISTSDVLKKLEQITPSQTIQITYFSKPKTLSAYSHYTVLKYSTVCGKIGIDYSELESVKNRASDPKYVPTKRNLDTTWVISKKVQHNNKTGSDLLFFYPNKTDKATTEIVLLDSAGNESVIDYTTMRIYCGSAGQPKLNENGEKQIPELIQIHIENICSLEIIDDSN